MSDAPERIYLQLVDDDDPWSDTTWCVDKIHPDDIPYIREPEPCVWPVFDDDFGHVWYRDPHEGAYTFADEVSFCYCPYCAGPIVTGESKG